MRWRSQAHPRPSVSMATMGVSGALRGYLHSQDTYIIHVRIVLLDTFTICQINNIPSAYLRPVCSLYTYYLYMYNLHHNVLVHKHSFVMLYNKVYYFIIITYYAHLCLVYTVMIGPFMENLMHSIMNDPLHAKFVFYTL